MLQRGDMTVQKLQSIPRNLSEEQVKLLIKEERKNLDDFLNTLFEITKSLSENTNQDNNSG